MTRYYVYKSGGIVTTIAMIKDGLPYVYKDDKWVFAPRLAKIQHEITDFKEISKKSVKQLMKRQ